MKKSILITLIGILAAGYALAQSEETRSLSSFSEVYAQEGIEVFLKEGSSEEARVVSENIDIDEVLTEVRGDRLKIHLEGNNYRNVNVQVYVSYKQLSALGASSAASIEAEDPIEASGDFDVDVSSAGEIKAAISADEMTLDASSSGEMNLEVNADEIEADVSSSGEIEVSGTVRYQEVEASSAGEYDASDVAGEEVDASASSGGSIKVNVSNKIDASASSGGSVRYSGSPKYVDVSSSSGGSVKKS